MHNEWQSFASLLEPAKSSAWQLSILKKFDRQDPNFNTSVVPNFFWSQRDRFKSLWSKRQPLVLLSESLSSLSIGTVSTFSARPLQKSYDDDRFIVNLLSFGLLKKKRYCTLEFYTSLVMTVFGCFTSWGLTRKAWHTCFACRVSLISCYYLWRLILLWQPWHNVTSHIELN